MLSIKPRQVRKKPHGCTATDLVDVVDLN